MEGLRQITLSAACTGHYEFVLVRKLVDTENSDDILKILIFLKKLFHLLRYIVVFLTDNIGIENT